MAEFLTAAALVLVVLAAVGLIWLLRAPSVAERMMAVQLAGTAGTGVALLLAIAQGMDAIVDVALVLAVLAAFGAAALASAAGTRSS
ncbi:monovalent cation/H+ antiporter complex subunit F [Ancylobacter sp. MQZ15Z-1]|uniref:Monovalent cation/H+ antiporter complex subunit F n=1 Tax=Ancylobacter mangrovi TaxID=2972472 RepID=A0A9X2PGF7_9HYPH|nr:monovalent cation/H+ antiporter complex subunit F [Ancylobacter mangrovi]MCS0495555.1 monovalent cation/H+ antiporter complex subunit F [Ancylobacter mangrovi]